MALAFGNIFLLRGPDSTPAARLQTCPSGLKCRFGRSHTDPETLKPIAKPSAVDPSTYEHINDLSRSVEGALLDTRVSTADCNDEKMADYSSTIMTGCFDIDQSWLRVVVGVFFASSVLFAEGGPAASGTYLKHTTCPACSRFGSYRNCFEAKPPSEPGPHEEQ